VTLKLKLATKMSTDNKSQLEETHSKLNSQLKQLLKITILLDQNQQNSFKIIWLKFNNSTKKVEKILILERKTSMT
jgi:hypothetical protein